MTLAPTREIAAYRGRMISRGCGNAVHCHIMPAPVRSPAIPVPKTVLLTLTRCLLPHG